MSILRVDHSAGGWTAIPRAALEHPDLSIDSIGLLGWLLVKPSNWEVRPDTIRNRFGLGREKWGRLTQELMKAGFYRRVIGRDARGRVWTHIVVSPVPHVPSPAKPVVGPADSRSILQPIKEEVKEETKEEEKNNNQEGKTEFDLIDGVPSDLLKRILHEVPSERRQLLADEIVGQFRIRRHEIKNFGAFATAIVTADRACGWAGIHHYAAGEAQVRAGRKRAKERNPFDQKIRAVPAPVPPEVRALSARLHSNKKYRGDTK